MNINKIFRAGLTKWLLTSTLFSGTNKIIAKQYNEAAAEQPSYKPKRQDETYHVFDDWMITEKIQNDHKPKSYRGWKQALEKKETPVEGILKYNEPGDSKAEKIINENNDINISSR